MSHYLNLVEANTNDLLRSGEKANGPISESSKSNPKKATQPLNKTFVEEDVSASPF